MAMDHRESSPVREPSERLFAAVRLAPETGRALAAARDRAEREMPFAKWVHPEDYHITLQFFGDTPKTAIPELAAALRRAAQGMPPFRQEADGFGTFGLPESPRVLWAGVGGDLKALHRLQEAVASETAGLGFKREDRPYHPHITLARKYKGRKPFDRSRLALPEHPGMQSELTAHPSWTVNGLVLYATRMSQTPMYEVLEHISLE